MKKDRIAKVYDGLTNKERAALAFRYLSYKNWLECERVESSVPWYGYTCIDFQYQQWRNRFLHMACYWAIEHWRLRARQWAALALFHLLVQRRERDQAHEAMAQHKQFEARLLALDLALEATCKEHGLDIEAVREFFGT